MFKEFIVNESKQSQLMKLAKLTLDGKLAKRTQNWDKQLSKLDLMTIEGIPEKGAVYEGGEGSNGRSTKGMSIKDLTKLGLTERNNGTGDYVSYYVSLEVPKNKKIKITLWDIDYEDEDGPILTKVLETYKVQGVPIKD